jgi:hypothetical protein
MLSLAEALRTGQLEEFIAQEEARGVPRATLRKMDRALARTLSRSPARPEDAGSRPHSRLKRKLDDAIYSHVGFWPFMTVCLV